MSEKNFENIQKIVDQVSVDLEEALEIPNGEIMQYILTEIVRYALFENKAVIDFVDSGYDFSSYGRKTDQKFVLSDYRIIREFLEEPTGNTIATHESGMGFRAETIEEIVNYLGSELIKEFVEKWLKDKNVTFDSEDECEFWDMFFDLDISYGVFGVSSRIEDLPFMEIVNQFKDQAILRQKEIDLAEKQYEEKLKKDAETACNIHKYVLSLIQGNCKKFSMSEKDLLQQILEKTANKFTKEEMDIYVRSSDFGTITSSKLSYLMLKRFGLPEIY